MSSENTQSASQSEQTESYESDSSDDNIQQEENLKLEANIISNYNVICELGRGAYSIVWLAYKITDNNFYALKVQNPTEYKDGLSEIKFVQKLPKEPPLFNNLVEYFIETREQKKYLCSVWELHCSNIDGLIRKGDYSDGFPLDIVKKIMKQLIESVKILHRKFKVFHGDIKTDNILVRGLNDKDAFIIKSYKEEKFFDVYTQKKKEFWLGKGNSLDKINMMSQNDKLFIRRQVHKEITNKILDLYHMSDISKHSINSKYLERMNISLADFGTHCPESDHYTQQFGTRYYQAPEIILMGPCSYPVDIWAIGCTFYELLTGKLLFDPIKDSKRSRDYYHLCLINETCGNFPEKFLNKTKYARQYFDYDNKIINYDIPKENRLDRKLKELNVSEDDLLIIKELLKSMLQIEPSKRITIDELSRHKFINF
jgi:serine/threonine protein kinase